MVDRPLRQKTAKATSACGLLTAALTLAPTAAPGQASEATTTVAGHTAVNTSATPPPGLACSTDGWVKACYEPLGDKIWVKDAKADGHHAMVWWWVTGSASDDKTCHDYHGKNAGWTVCNDLAALIPEHDYITIWPMEMEGGSVVPNSGGSQAGSPTT